MKAFSFEMLSFQNESISEIILWHPQPSWFEWKTQKPPTAMRGKASQQRHNARRASLWRQGKKAEKKELIQLKEMIKEMNEKRNNEAKELIEMKRMIHELKQNITRKERQYNRAIEQHSIFLVKEGKERWADMKDDDDENVDDDDDDRQKDVERQPRWAYVEEDEDDDDVPWDVHRAVNDLMLH
jgi:hypothetical protein